MNISITDVSLQELTVLCSRIGEISVREIAQEEKAQAIQSYVDSGMTETEAAEKQNQDFEEKVETVLQQQAPKEPDPQISNSVQDMGDALAQLATEKFVTQGRSNELIAILSEYHIRSIPELDKSKYEELYERLINA